MKPVHFWILTVLALAFGGVLALAAYAALHGSLKLVVATYGLMVVLVLATLFSLAFVVPREKSFTRPWLLSNLISAPVALVFVVMLFYRGVGCVLYDPAYLFSTVLAFVIFTLISPVFIFPAPLKFRLPAAVIAMLVLLVPGFRLSDPLALRQEVKRHAGALRVFFAGNEDSNRAILQTIRDSDSMPGRQDHVWQSQGDDGVVSRNFGPLDSLPLLLMVGDDEIRLFMRHAVDGAQFLRLNARLEDMEESSAEVAESSGDPLWMLAQSQRDLQIDTKDGGEFRGFFDIVARNVETDDVSIFEGLELGMVAGWQDADTLLAVRRIVTERPELVNVPSENPDEFGEWRNTPGKSRMELLALDLPTGGIDVLRHVDLDQLVSIVTPNEDHGVMLAGTGGDDQSLLYLDWRTGEVIPLLAGIDSESLAVVKTGSTIHFACQQTLPDESRRLVMGTQEGVVATLPIADGQKTVFAYPSPDGQKALIAIRQAPWGHETFGDFVVYSIWDRRTNQVTRLVGHGPMAAFFNPDINFRFRLSQMVGMTESPWSADGRKVAFLTRESTGYDLSHRPRIHIAHFEEWAER